MSNATADQTPSSQLTKNPSKKIKPTARVRKRLQDAPPVTLTVTNLAHDGRGVASYGDQPDHLLDKHGKKVFVSFALPNETVSVKITGSRKSMEEGDAIEVLANPNPERT
ncbi:MAG TPA: 23S rRNA (uracil(1939)-C(5))-methyltransferase, partial [Moraxella sp.]|nr:23S rRNA (uracil(1939)-C(5))-methyltransferase [Moraxella sp.]